MSDLVSLVEAYKSCGFSIEEAKFEAKATLERAEREKERVEREKERAYTLELEKMKMEQINKQAELNGGALAGALAKIDKKLKFMVKEVVTQHRIRMDIWTESKRSKEEQGFFKDALIAFYQRQHPTDSNLLRCMILGECFPKHLVIASHIWKRSTNGAGLEEFNLKEDDINNPRNGMLLCKEIELAFDSKRLCFLVDRFHTGNLVLKVLDPLLANPATSPLVIDGLSEVRFFEIDGYLLQCPADKLPFRRILDFHAKLSYQKAIKRGWLEPSSTFDTFFDMSIDASIPDLNLYETIIGDED